MVIDQIHLRMFFVAQSMDIILCQMWFLTLVTTNMQMDNSSCFFVPCLFRAFITLIPPNLLPVTLASVQTSYLQRFSLHLIPELKLDVSPYTYYESQRGSGIRSTQITTFFVAPCRPPLSYSAYL